MTIAVDLGRKATKQTNKHTRNGLNLPRKSVKANGSKCSSFLSAMCFPFAKLSKDCSVGTFGIVPGYIITINE